MTQHERLAKNEALFREVNERIQEVDEHLQGPGMDESSLWEFICECADETCFERVELLPKEYESVRDDSRQFVIVPGHEVGGIEQVVSRKERFTIVEKTAGEPARIAVETDPRA